ncbi:MAG: cation diffusion facilitator family transporter [Candidatus Daviesbacteria bacterium]|nr:cation diffusion facilitator family transporter [Candidatus Daviesbacteria bacterium]
MKEVSAKKVIITSFIVDLIDIVTNITVALITGSIVMAAETLQGMADLTAVSFLIIGLSRSSRPADKSHPFGFGREIYFWTLMSSVIMLGFTATLSFFLGLQRFLHPEVLDNLSWAYAILTISILTNGYALSLDVRRIFKNNLSLKEFLQSPKIETKTTFVLDLMGVGAAVIGLISLLSYKFFGEARLDGVGAMGIGLILGLLSLLLIYGVRDLLIGKRASQEIEKNIKELTLSFPEVREIIDLRTEHSGSSYILVDLDVHLKNKLTTDQIEKLVNQIKTKIKQDVPSVGEIQIELKTS